MTKTYLHMALHNHFIEIVALTATEFNWIINSTTSIEYQPLYPDHSQKIGVELKKKKQKYLVANEYLSAELKSHLQSWNPKVGL